MLSNYKNWLGSHVPNDFGVNTIFNSIFRHGIRAKTWRVIGFSTNPLVHYHPQTSAPPSFMNHLRFETWFDSFCPYSFLINKKLIFAFFFLSYPIYFVFYILLFLIYPLFIFVSNFIFLYHSPSTLSFFVNIFCLFYIFICLLKVHWFFFIYIAFLFFILLIFFFCTFSSQLYVF